MGVEVAGFEKAPSPIDPDNTIGSHDKESGKPVEHVKLSSHDNSAAKGEVNKVSDIHFPKDAVDEWPEHKVHYLYFIRCRPLDDPKIKAKMDNADKEITRWTKARFQAIEKIKAKRSERGELISQLKPLDAENKQFRLIVDERRKEMEPLQQALGKFRTANAGGRGNGLCSSEEELNEMIQSLNYRIQHESIPLSEEKQILREIKQLEGTRDKVIANAAMISKLQESLGQKEVIQDQVKLLGVDLDGVRKDQHLLKGRITNLRAEVNRVDEDIKNLEEELTEITEKKDKAYKDMQELRKLRDEGNKLFFENRTLLNHVRDLASKKDVKALQELSRLEVDKFIVSWSNNKSFRHDYEKRLMQSLDGRQMSKDGRSRNPGEKPLVAVENPTPPQTEAVPKVNQKKPKEEPKATQVAHSDEAAVIHKAKKEAAKKADEHETASEDVEPVPKEKNGSKKLAKEQEVEREVDPEKLKEMKREEQIAKAKQALERKKKLAEKNAAKAAAKAQKEAEKKLKDREKKLKKKAAASTPAANLEEPPEEASEQDVDPTPEAPHEEKEKDKKVPKEKNTARHRGRARGSESIPKIMPKRKKSTNYWVWAGPGAVALVLLVLLLALGYKYYA